MGWVGVSMEIDAPAALSEVTDLATHGAAGVGWLAKDGNSALWGQDFTL